MAASREEVNAQARQWRASPAGKAWYRRWYAVNRGRKLAEARRWREANPEKVKAQVARKRLEPEKVRASARRTYLKHRDKRLEQARNYYHMTKEQRRVSLNRWQRANPEKVKTYYRKYTYGLTPDEQKRLIASQGNACAICGKACDPAAGAKRDGLQIDHDHLTGTVRGLLCTGCNRGLGFFRDNVTALRAAIEYLERFQKTEEVA